METASSIGWGGLVASLTLVAVALVVSWRMKLGLERSTAVYLSDRLAAEPEKVRRDTLRDLNLVLTTTVLEFLTAERAQIAGRVARFFA